MRDAYRDERSPLRARLEELEGEAAAIDAALGQADELRRRRAELEAERARLRERLEHLDARDPLDGLRVASPCKAKWEDMTGDERVRFCRQCEKSVFDVAGMTRAEAHALLAAHAGGTVCLRLFRRADGTVLTADCPEGVKRKRVRRLAMLAVGGVAAAAGASSLAVMGSVRPDASEVGPKPVSALDDDLSSFEGVLGTIAVPDDVKPRERLARVRTKRGAATATPSARAPERDEPHR